MKINEIFFSVQGEGLNTGLPTVFVRTTGCNLRCSYCDTTYAYYNGKELSIDKIVSSIRKFHSKRVCITGGEPLMQENILKLISKLKDYSVSIETNGSMDISILPPELMVSLDIKCPSSGETDKMLLRNLRHLRKKDQVKFIISSKKDYEMAKKTVRNFSLTTKTNVIFSPIGEIKAASLVKSVLKDKLDARIGLQIHKIIWAPGKRGV